MKVFIPELGTKLVLSKPWSVVIINERRNAPFVRLVMKVPPQGDATAPYWNNMFPLGYVWDHDIHCTSVSFGRDGRRTEQKKTYDYYKSKDIKRSHTFPKGTELVVDRIYIRQGAAAFSSVTFKLKVGKRIARFFAKLSEVNQMEVR